MRVIAGKARGKKLLSPQTDKIRPTLDRVKESLFNIIGFEIRDCSFLDLFCGSGAIGIEAISRDADKVYFVDRDSSSIELTQKNIESCKYDSTKYKILRSMIIMNNDLEKLYTNGADYAFLMSTKYTFTTPRSRKGI